MIVVRRAAVGLAVAGMVLLGGTTAQAQDADPCAPGPDGSVAEMCQGGMAPEPDPAPGGGSDPTDPCLGQPVEPGDGVVTDPGTTAPATFEPGSDGTDGSEPTTAVSEPNSNAPAEDPPVAESEVKPEPATDPDAPVSNEPPDVISDPGVICAFGVPVNSPVADGAPLPEVAAGGAVTAVDMSAPGAAAPEAAAQLPRTGPVETLILLAAAGVALLLLGGGAVAAGRRRAEV